MAFPADVDQTLQWAAQHVSLHDNSIAYGIFDPAAPEAVGICEVVISHPAPSSWIKLLRLRLSPKIEDQIFKNDPKGVKTALESYICGVLGVHSVKNEIGGTTIKIYGRTQEQVKFLTLLSASLQAQQGLAFKAALQGRWLVLDWSKK